MPMTFTDDVVDNHLDMFKLDTTGTNEEKRERLAAHMQDDPVEAWEIRTGRPWNEMTSAEAVKLCAKHPSLVRNPGIISRIAGGGDDRT